MSASFACPLCSAPWRAGNERCVVCGADLSDPDVQAFVAGQGGAAPPPAEPAGTLGAGRVLGLTLDGIADGRAIRRLALAGGFLALLAFAMPALRKFHYELDRFGDRKGVGEYFFSWDLWSQGNRFGLLFPLLAGVIGLAVALVPGLSVRVRAGALAATGLVGVLFGLGRLGEYALAPTSTGTLAIAGVLIAGTAMAARLLLPTSMNARYALVLGGVVFLAGLLLPTSELAARLPADYTFRADRLDIDLASDLPITAIAAGVDRRASEIFFAAIWLLAPLVLVPLAAALAWRQPSGIWDKGGLALRPLTWTLVMYVPIFYAILAFSVFGWQNQLAESALAGRLRLFVLAVPTALWAQLGLLALIVAPRKS